MSIEEIQEELYAHAVMYYFDISIPTDNPLKRYLIKHCSIVDLEDNGDTKIRKEIYRLIWKLDLKKEKDNIELERLIGKFVQKKIG